MPAKMFGKRTALPVLALGLCAGLFFAALSGHGQEVQPGVKKDKKDPNKKDQPEPSGGSPFSIIRLSNDSNMNKRIDAAHDAIEKEKNWEKAVTILQESILNKDGSFYVQVREKDINLKETVRWTSARIEATILM